MLIESEQFPSCVLDCQHHFIRSLAVEYEDMVSLVPLVDFTRLSIFMLHQAAIFGIT